MSLPSAALRTSSRRRSTSSWSRSSLNALSALELVLLALGIDAQDVLDLDVVLDVLVDADDDVLLEAVALLVAPGGLVDLAA